VTFETARRRAAILRYAAIQFIALTALAMAMYAGGSFADPAASGYAFFDNFFSDLGATRSWSGAPNQASSVLFGIALGTMGIAFIAFAGTSRAFAGPARRAAIAAQLFGTASGAAFVAVAVTPVDLALAVHNTFVGVAFGSLLGYAVSMTIVWWRARAGTAQLAGGIAYLVIVGGYVVVVFGVVGTGLVDSHGRMILIAAQKAIAYASMLYIGYVTTMMRRQIAPVAVSA
jgi:hypothetical protein